MKEIISRFKNESPSFFKKLQVWMISVGTIGVGIVALPTQIPQVTFPAALITLGYHLITVGVIGGILAKLPVSDPTVLKQEDKINEVTPPSTPK